MGVLEALDAEFVSTPVRNGCFEVDRVQRLRGNEAGFTRRFRNNPLGNLVKRNLST
jgi:hypothetical protein